MKVAGLAFLLALTALTLLATTGPVVKRTELAAENHGEKQVSKAHLQEDDTDQKKFAMAFEAVKKAYRGGQLAQAKASLAQAKDALDDVDSDSFPHDGKLIKKEMSRALTDLEKKIDSGAKHSQTSLRAQIEESDDSKDEEHNSNAESGEKPGWGGPAVKNGIKVHHSHSTHKVQLKHKVHRQMQLRQKQEVKVTAPKGGWGAKGSPGPGPAHNQNPKKPAQPKEPAHLAHPELPPGHGPAADEIHHKPALHKASAHPKITPHHGKAHAQVSNKRAHPAVPPHAGK